MDIVTEIEIWIDKILDKHAIRSGKLLQAWFPGMHSNIGGGYTPDGLANEALHWMVEQAETLGLEFDSTYLAHFKPCFNSKLHDSMTFMYKAMGPHTRTIGEHIGDGETVHQSAIDRKRLTSCAYDPSNLNDFLEKTASTQTDNTTRITRGTPCPDL